MPRTAKIEVTASDGAITNGAIWANHTLVADQAPPATWEGKIPMSATPLTVEVNGVGTSKYNLKVTVDNTVVLDVERQLHEGFDEFKKPL